MAQARAVENFIQTSHACSVMCPLCAAWSKAKDKERIAKEEW